MNDTITASNEIITVLDYLSSKFGIVIDWTSETVWPQIQNLCTKYIGWEIATSWAWIIVAILGLILCVLVGISMVRDDDEDLIFIPIMIGVFLIVCIGFQISDLLTCYYFPEKQIFDFINLHIHK